MNLSQTPTAERPSIYDELTRADGWDEINRDGTTIHVTKLGATGHQVQAHVGRDGTFVFLMSETLSAEQLTTIASSLVPSPSSSSI